MKIKDKILIQLKEKGDLSVKEMSDLLDVSTQGIHIALNQLLEAETVLKFGRTPKTIYRLAAVKTTIIEEILTISPDKQDFLAQHFLAIT